MKKRIFLLLLLLPYVHHEMLAQPGQLVKVIVGADHDDWTYKTGETAKFNVMVIRSGNPVKDAVVSYKVGPEKMDPTMQEENVVLKKGTLTINGGTLKSPGFLRCEVVATVDGKEYRGLATAGFDPLSIKPTVDNPADFVEFWDKAKQENAAVPIDAIMTLLPERCTEKVNVYHVNLQNYRRGSRFYGILCVPKAEGKYPALLRVPGAGVRPYNGDVATAEKGIITFEVGIHGIPVDLELPLYQALGAGALNRYFTFNLDDKDAYYYKRVYLGCVRANDFLFSLPQFDGVNLAVTGGSQGGALSIVTAALDPRVKYLAAYFPALSDMTGYLKGRAGGWPHIFDKNHVAVNNTKAKLETVSYYDVVNFARQLKVPGFYSWGFNDEVCPPTSMYSAYNVITAPKELHVALETGHWTFPEQREWGDTWLLERLKPGK
ncbi:MAG TPA: acetylxylan esterase [Cyclobacteriaceae bacterium]